MENYRAHRGAETADAKAMRDKANHTLIHLVAVMEAEFLAPKQLRHLPEQARPEQALMDIPPNWFSKPLAGVDWRALAAEARCEIESYDELLFCLHAVREFKSQAAALNPWSGAGKDGLLSPVNFKEQMRSEIQRLQATVAMIALGCDALPVAAPLPRREQDEPMLSGLRRPYVYQFRSSVTEAFIKSWRWKDTLLAASESYASGYIPRLLVFEDVGASALLRLERSYAKFGGNVFSGEVAWEHVAAGAGEDIQRFIARYCRDPFALVPAMRPAPLWEGELDSERPSWTKTALQGRC